MKARPNRKTGAYHNCLVCQTEFYKRKSEPNRRFCSHGCASQFKRVYPIQDRSCEQCSNGFRWSAKPVSNSSGRFCSLACRNDSYVKLVKVPGHTHRTRWRSIRNKFLVLNNFCNKCGTKSKDRRLAVHHIEPYRVAQNDDHSNLVTLCHRCHMREEIISKKIALLPKRIREQVVALIQADFHDVWHIYKGLELENRAG